MNKSSLPQFLRKLRFLLGDLPNIFTPKRNLTPLPNSCRVLRLSNVPKDYREKGNVLAIQLDEVKAFELSSLDKKTPPPHLSVWDESLTTAEQAYSFLQENSPCKLVICLNVAEVRNIEVVAENNKYSGLLNIIWVHLFQESNGKKIQDRRPGAKGHCGITGLDEESTPEGLTNRQAKNFRKSLRFQLAELASKNHSLLDE
ncbi:MAG: hypothetical protein RMY63_05025 [Nostoc sp. ChiQUE01b]|nr:hypothetical protein [Nostoc sp. ChiQUE01b]